MRSHRPEIKSRRKPAGLIFVISGPSGSGKTTLVDRVLQEPALKGRLAKSVSFTTRPKRSTESQGREYFFISERRFQQAKQAKKILEWTSYLGYYYGTPLGYLRAQREKGKHLIMCLDLSGTRKIKRLYPGSAVTVFVLPPSLNALRARIRRRCARTLKEEISNRLDLAGQELATARYYDHQLVNDKLETIVRKLRGIILDKINLKPKPSTAYRGLRRNKKKKASPDVDRTTLR